jgi:single-stranded-DNA-specific exonuclease
MRLTYANSHGLTVIVTDHHDLGETLPNAKAIINPKLLPEDHPLRNLAGVGVAYKLAEALLNAEGGMQKAELLDLVALGLIADVALLKNETRTLAKQGIEQLRNTNRIGLRVMAELAGATFDSLTEETIGFTFAPRSMRSVDWATRTPPLNYSLPMTLPARACSPPRSKA